MRELAARPIRACRQRAGTCRRCGFTLVELVIAIGLIGLLARVATLMWVDGFGLVTTINEDTSTIADGRILLERLSREIREVKYSTSAGAYCISSSISAPAGQMVFKKTSTGAAYSATCGSNDFGVTLSNASGNRNLLLSYSAAPAVANAVLTPHVSTLANSFAINYLQADGSTAATTNSNVRFVQLTLTLVPPGGQNTVSKTTVALRNS